MGAGQLAFDFCQSPAKLKDVMNSPRALLKSFVTSVFVAGVFVAGAFVTASFADTAKLDALYAELQ